MKRTVPVLMLLMLSLSAFANPAFQREHVPTRNSGQFEDISTYNGFNWFTWSTKERHAYIMGFQTASFKIIEFLWNEGQLNANDPTVQEVLLDQMSTETLRAVVTGWYLKHQHEGSMHFPVWEAIFHAKAEAQL